MINTTEKDLKTEIADMRERFPRLQDSELFVAWFLKCFVTESEEEAIAALVGGPKDKSLDAIFVDDQSKKVFIVQGKYRRFANGASEHRSDVMAFADLAQVFSDSKAFASFVDGLETSAAGKAEQVRQRIRSRGYGMQLYFVTTGRCSPGLAKEAERLVRQADAPADLDIIDGKRILRLLSDYLDGVAPPVPLLELEVENGMGIDLRSVLQRFDGNLGIESWVFPVNVRHIADMYEKSGVRLFARNVRGFLGDTAINGNMETTLQKEPAYFWYYNNGITIICDEAEKLDRGGRMLMRIVNPQVINGQQTTRTLHKKAARDSKACVLVRVISVPRENDEEANQFDNLISKIVAATNWQNAIRASDLMSNDRRQIDLERNFRKLDYQYLRKRQSKGEARRHAGVRHRFLVKKEDLAQAVAACDLDPFIVREGKERLFEERFYSQVFPNAAPDYYLPRYWLVNYTAYAARGYPERAYAKWIVTHFVWQELNKILHSRHLRTLFIQINERERVASLVSLCNSVFKGTSRFYRAKRGTGEKAIDVSTFFKRKGLHKDFERFWTGHSGPHKRQFVKALKIFKERMRETAEDR
ncbi:MAG TPA: AIPR family protein [Kiritimatiellia bacterium]|nr:AIPR family protein [Kiritimatiellia bacterium]